MKEGSVGMVPRMVRGEVRLGRRKSLGTCRLDMGSGVPRSF